MASSSTAPGAGPSLDTARLRDRLLAWYDRTGRALPWRAPAGRRPDPYRVLVSELMLQQTRAAAVGPHFARFLARFPSLEALARAPLDDVLHAWQGLGYYRRARALHACARILVYAHGGRVPEDREALLALPGIGAYTAGALRAIAFGLPEVPVDGNVRRVLSRLARIEEPLERVGAKIDALAASLAGGERPGDAAQALMDLGALVCTPRRPACDICPWQGACRAHAADVAEALPRRLAKPARPLRRGIAFLLRRADGAILFRRRPDHGLLGGMVELPSSPWQAAMPTLAEAAAHAPAAGAWRLHPGRVRHIFTHLTLELALAEARTRAPPAGLWCPPERLGQLALPSLTRRLLGHAGVEAGR